MTIIDQFVSGIPYDPELLDDEIDEWYRSDSSLELYQWLGFTEAEYERWITDPKCILDIIMIRKSS